MCENDSTIETNAYLECDFFEEQLIAMNIEFVHESHAIRIRDELFEKCEQRIYCSILHFHYRCDKHKQKLSILHKTSAINF